MVLVWKFLESCIIPWWRCFRCFSLDLNEFSVEYRSVEWNCWKWLCSGLSCLVSDWYRLGISGEMTRTRTFSYPHFDGPKVRNRCRLIRVVETSVCWLTGLCCCPRYFVRSISGTVWSKFLCRHSYSPNEICLVYVMLTRLRLDVPCHHDSFSEW